MTKPLPPKSLVLYADDDSDDLALLREAFLSFGEVIDLMTFKDGVELLAFLDKLPPLEPGPCLIVLDINMPRLTGIEVLKLLRQKNGMAEVPVVLFSTSTQPAEAAVARSYNAGFVTKPLVNSQVQQIVAKLVSHCSEEVKQRLNKK